MPKTRLIRGHMVYDSDSDDSEIDILNYSDSEYDKNPIQTKFERFESLIKNNPHDKSSIDLINELFIDVSNLNHINSSNQEELIKNKSFIKNKFLIVLMDFLHLANKFDISLSDLVDKRLSLTEIKEESK